MMEGILIGAASAFWLGILTSISPCPLATNIAAMSFIGRKVGNPRQVFLAGFLYTVGRMATYLAISMILVGSLLSAPVVSQLLQKYMNKLLGPILILVGMFLLEMLEFHLRGSGVGERTRTRVEGWGIWGAGFLGILFALSFCPVSAALFFGSLIPLSVNYSSSVFLPGLYGVGTGLPVFVFAVFIALGAGAVGKAFDRITQFEKWARKITGVVFILVGVYFTLVHIFGFSLG